MDSALLQTIIAVLGSAIGGGVIGVIVKARTDKQLGIAAQATTDDDAIAHRWEDFARTQVDLLVNPLRVEVQTLTEKVRHLESEVTSTRTRYWKAISYARELRGQLIMHRVDPPAPPADIVADI